MSEQVEKAIKEIKERNARVEADKAWETSRFRIATLAGSTYITAAFFLVGIGAKNALLSALVPAIGYVLSTQSLPVLKRWWVKKILGTK